MTAMARIMGRNGALRYWSSRAVGIGMAIFLCSWGIGRCQAALVTDADIKAAKAACKHAEDAWSDANKALNKHTSALKKAQEREAELQSDLATLKKKFSTAPREDRGKLSLKVREAQEELNRAVKDRAALDTDVARAQAQAQARRTEADNTKKACDDLIARQKTEMAEWKQRQAEEAAKATPAPAAVPVPAAPVTVAPAAPVTVAPAAPVTVAPAATVAPLEEKAKQAQAGKAQADAVVTQRAGDLEKAKDAKARQKAESALSEAEKYAATKEKEQQAAAAELEKAKEQPAAAVTPRAFERAPQVSEPAPWAPPAPPQPAPVLHGDQRLAIPEPTPAEIAPPGTKLQFDVPMLAGDKEIAQDLDVWKEWATYITFNPVSAEEINEFHGKFTKALQEKGYVFAKVTFPTRIWAYGIFLAKVDCGPLGTITVTGNRHYSAKQIIDALADKPGARFNYARVHGDLFDLNAKPDLNIDAKLRPSIQNGRRVVDADLQVEDDLPVHGSIELSNTGTSDTNDWRIRSSLQHVNLTKHDDVLTVEWLTSPDISDVNAYSAAYFLPLDDRWSMSLYAGLSDSDIDDVLPQLDVRGRGHFGGGQLTRVLEETARYRTQLSAGWLYQYWEDEQEISGVTWEDRRLRLSMPSVTYGYSSRVFDKLGGRNFASVTGMANFAGNFGSSTTEEFVGEGGTGFTDGDFTLARFQLARLQRFFKGEDEPGKWTVFMRVDGQFSGDSLPSAVRRSVGGANSVRGYEEGEVSGDNAVTATVELRTPLFRNFICPLKKTDEYLDANPEAWQQHRLQFIIFGDAGWLQNKEPLPGEMDSETLASLGVGLRFGFTKYLQARLDYGYALEDTTEDTPSSGALHLSVQGQF